MEWLLPRYCARNAALTAITFERCSQFVYNASIRSEMQAIFSSVRFQVLIDLALQPARRQRRFKALIQQDRHQFPILKPAGEIGRTADQTG